MDDARASPSKLSGAQDACQAQAGSGGSRESGMHPAVLLPKKLYCLSSIFAPQKHLQFVAGAQSGSRAA